MDAEIKDIETQLQALMGARNGVTIWALAGGAVMARGSAHGVAKCVADAAAMNVEVWEVTKPDPTNPFCDGLWSVTFAAKGLKAKLDTQHQTARDAFLAEMITAG